MNIQIKNTLGKVLFEYDKENNTIKDTVVKALEEGVNLSYADLRDTDLSGAYLSDANLSYADLKDANFRDANFSGADLSGADLSGTKLSGTNLIGADLRGADLRGADFSCGDLSGANLSGAYLSYTILKDANLSDANLSKAYLDYANLRNADLIGADLNGADLYEADLEGVKNMPHIPFVCPSEGSFIAWKKISHYKESHYKEVYRGNYIVKLLIPEDAKRSSATTNKCRCDKAKVLEITNIDNGSNVEVITNLNYNQCVYKVGEYVYPDRFDENRWNECSNGIHFFMKKEEAINY